MDAIRRGAMSCDLWICDALGGAEPDDNIRLARLRGLVLGGAALTLAMSAWKAIGPLTTSDLFLIAAVLLLLPRFDLANARRMWFPALAVALIAVGGVIGTVVGSNFTGSVDVLGRILAASLGAMLLLVCWRPSLEQIVSFSWLWIAGGVVSGMVALLVPELHMFLRPSGLAPHPTLLSIISLILLGVVLGLIASSRRRKSVVAGVAASSILIAAIIASGSRASLIGAAIVVLISVIGTRSRTAAKVLMGAGGVGLLVLLLGVVDLGERNALERLFESGAAGGEEREEFNRESWEQFKAHPVTGVGFAGVRSAHNLFLQVGSAAGVLGIAGAALLIVLTLRTYALAVWQRMPENPHHWAVVAGLAAGLIGYLAASMFQNVLWDRNVWVAVALMTWAATASLGRDPAPEATRRPWPSPAGKDAVGAG
jgi:hypothetical protein